MVSGPLTIVSDGSGSEPLPEEVREQPTAKTSVYKAGQLVYDGATGQRVDGGGSSGNPQEAAGDSLNELLKWSIAHSDPEELERRKAAGVSHPSRMDQEMLDVILGQPTVAKMRECLGKLEPLLQSADASAEERAVAILDEIEFYCDSIDDATDFAKIGGLQGMLSCLARYHDMPEVAQAACGVLAATLQNHPKLQESAVVLKVPQVLVRLLANPEKQPEAAASVAVRRKALLAFSALVRTAPASVRDAALCPKARESLLALGVSEDQKLRRRALFLLNVLVHEKALPVSELAVIDDVATLCLKGSCDEDEEVRESALQLSLALIAEEEAPVRAALIAAGAEQRLDELLKTLTDETPSHTEWARQLLEQLR